MKKKLTKEDIIMWIIIGFTAILAFIIGHKLGISKKAVLYILALIELGIYMSYQSLRAKIKKADKPSSTDSPLPPLPKMAEKREDPRIRTDFIDFLHEKGFTTADEAMKKVAINAIPLIKNKMSDSQIPIGACKMGGYPDLPSSIPYPVTTDSTGTQYAMQLMAQINLSEVSSFDTDLVLPQSGFLYIFWSGEIPAWSEGCDVYKVIYYEGDSFWLKRTQPDVPYYSKYFDGPLEPCRFSTQFSKNEYPINDLEEELGEFFEYYDGNYDVSGSKLLGYPVGSMNISGVHGDLINLFQFDYHSGSLWNVYWYISKEDLANKNFDHVLMDWDMD